MESNSNYSPSTGETIMDPEQVRKVAKAQRLLILAVVASILGLIPYVFIITIPFQLYCVWMLARALGFSTEKKVLYLILMIIPIVSLVALLVLNYQATTALRNAGIRVGLIGAKSSDLPTG